MSNEVQKASGTQIMAASSNPFDALKESIGSQKAKFQMILPAHISFEKFQSVVMTAAITDPALLRAHRGSLMLSAIKSATDGLFPDGRDAAFVRFNSKVKDPETGQDMWVDKVQYMPMFQGILKKVRQSDQISSITVDVVYDKDSFKVTKGDEEKIVHEPYEGEDHGELRAAYCIARLKDGSIQRTVMWRHEIEKVRKTSKSGAANANDVKHKKAAEIGEPKGIWKDWPEEMWKKTVFRRAAKWLPQSVDKEGNVVRIFDNDDSMDVIDAVEEDQAIGRVDDQDVIEDQGQPDLKKAIEEKKSEESAKSDDDTFPADRPSKASKQTKKDEPPADKERTPLDIEREIRAVMAKATNGVLLREELAVEYSADLDLIKDKTPAAYKTLKAAIDARIAELGGDGE